MILFARRIQTVTTVLVAAFLCGAPTVAFGQLTYSWSGRLVPAGVEDPWDLGAEGRPFDIIANLDANAPDLLNVDVEFSAHGLTNATLVLDDEELFAMSGATLDFTDNEPAAGDLVTLTGTFEKDGVAIEIGSVVALSSDTFAFTNPESQPPVFGHASNENPTGCCGGVYNAQVPSGGAVLATPEPASSCLSLAALALLARRRR